MIRTLLVCLVAFLLPFVANATPTASTKRAVATLRVPVFIVKGDGTTVPVAELNKDLKAFGVAEIPEYTAVSSDEKNADVKFGVVDKIIDEAIAKAGTAWVDASRNNPLFPTEGENTIYSTCYLGDAVAVPDAVSALAGIVYTEQLNMFGMKYKSYRRYFNSQNSVETETALSEGSALWKNWKGDDETVLILSSVGDGGDDIQESLIPVCK